MLLKIKDDIDISVTLLFVRDYLKSSGIILCSWALLGSKDLQLKNKLFTSFLYHQNLEKKNIGMFC